MLAVRSYCEHTLTTQSETRAIHLLSGQCMYACSHRIAGHEITMDTQTFASACWCARHPPLSTTIMGPLITKRRHYATPIAATTLTTHYGATTTLNRPSSSLWPVVVPRLWYTLRCRWSPPSEWHSSGGGGSLMSLFRLIRGRVCSPKIDREIHAGYSSLGSVVVLVRPSKQPLG